MPKIDQDTQQPPNQEELEARSAKFVRDWLETRTAQILERTEGELPDVIDEHGKPTEWWIEELWSPVEIAGAAQSTLEAARGHRSDEVVGAYGDMAGIAMLFSSRISLAVSDQPTSIPMLLNAQLDNLERPLQRGRQMAEHHQIFIRDYAGLLDATLDALDRGAMEEASQAGTALSHRAIQKFCSMSDRQMNT